MDRETQLTPREQDIMEMVVLEGARDPETIGERLAISPRTVKNHFANIYRKLGVNSKTEAVSVLLRNGQIELPHVGGLREELRKREFIIHCLQNYGRNPTDLELEQRGFTPS